MEVVESVEAEDDVEKFIRNLIHARRFLVRCVEGRTNSLSRTCQAWQSQAISPPVPSSSRERDLVVPL